MSFTKDKIVRKLGEVFEPLNPWLVIENHNSIRLLSYVLQRLIKTINI